MPASSNARLWIVVASIVAVGGAFLGWKVLASPKAPRGLVVEPRSLDFGRVARGEAHRRVLTLRNTSEHDLTIGQVTGNCRCFKVELGFMHLLHPGESTEVRIDMDTSETPAGPVRGKQLTIPSNDEHRPIQEVALRADIFDVLKVEPGLVDYGTISREAVPAPRTVTFVPGADSKLRLVRTEVSEPDTFETSTAPKGDGFDLTVKFKEPGYKAWVAAKRPLRTTVVVSVDVTSPDRVRKIHFPLRIQGD